MNEKYIVLEIQTSDTVATLVTSYDNKNAAESAYHQVLASAAISQIPIHSAMIITSSGIVIKNESYYHIQEEPEE